MQIHGIQGKDYQMKLCHWTNNFMLKDCWGTYSVVLQNLHKTNLPLDNIFQHKINHQKGDWVLLKTWLCCWLWRSSWTFYWIQLCNVLGSICFYLSENKIRLPVPWSNSSLKTCIVFRHKTGLDLIDCKSMQFLADFNVYLKNYSWILGNVSFEPG